MAFKTFGLSWVSGISSVVSSQCANCGQTIANDLDPLFGGTIARRNLGVQLFCAGPVSPSKIQSCSWAICSPTPLTQPHSLWEDSVTLSGIRFSFLASRIVQPIEHAPPTQP